MKSGKNGIVTSGVEVVQLTPHGIWLDIEGKEYFLDHALYPWFQEAPIHAVWQVELTPAGNLHWPELDIDLERSCLDDPQGYPLVYR
jgi:hypothetical protein